MRQYLKLSFLILIGLFILIVKIENVHGGEKKSDEERFAAMMGYDNAVVLSLVYDTIKNKGLDKAKKILYYLPDNMTAHTAYDGKSHDYFLGYYECSHNFKAFQIVEPYVIFYQNDRSCGRERPMTIAVANLKSVRKGQYINDATHCKWFKLVGMWETERLDGFPINIPALNGADLELEKEWEEKQTGR
jgi:hypothetical protein